MQLLTANEIVNAAGFNPEEIGKTRCRIAGVPVNSRWQLIRIQDEVGEVEVILGKEAKIASYTPTTESIVSEQAHSIKEKQGKKVSEPHIARQKAKAEAKAKADATKTPEDVVDEPKETEPKTPEGKKLPA